MSWDSQLTPQEQKYFVQLFQSVSKTQDGIVTGNEAVRFFATSGVPNEILSEIWEAADRDKVGYLTPETFSIALKLIACAQHAVPLPQFDGVAPSPISTPLLSAPSINSSIITAAEREKYANIFKVHQPVNGVLDANTARNVFLKSKLPMDTLGQIWNLADVRQSGSLNQTEFIIAMHYIAKLMDGTLSSLPDKLPPAVFQSANGSTTQQSPLVRNMTLNSPAIGGLRQHSIMTPPQRARTIDSLGNLAFGPSAPIHEPVQQWDVSAQEKQQFDAYFNKIDSAKAELIQGKEAVEFFKNSRLPEAELAHIWDLSDIQQRGALSRDEFAVAMYLIHKRLAGDQLPQTLPKSLIPPSNQLQSPFTNVVSSPSLFSASSPAFTQRSVVDNDLLGDFGNDNVAHETNQVNLMSNQISSLSLQTNDIQNQKVSGENTLAQLTNQKKELEAQMTSVRMAHEAAVKDLNEIQETVRHEEGEWDQVRNQYEISQQELTTLQNEIAQMQQTLENGRAETESLRRRVNEIQEETKKANDELNALRAQNKQTNMMLDINKRQVTAAEQDRSLAKRNLEDYKVAADLNQNDQDSSVVTTPALQNLFGDSPTINPTSPFAEFSSVADQNANPIFADAFSATPTPTAGDNDFDAIFGNIGSPTTTTATSTPVHAFDQWVAAPSTPTGKTSRGPPPPPPQSRHHRQTSEVSSITSAVSAPSKKARAPPPPPPVGLFSPALSTPQINETSDKEDSDDNFEAAFSEKLPEAKIVAKVDDDEFADFDDAFVSFDAKPSSTSVTSTNQTVDTPVALTAAPTTPPPNASTDDWTSGFDEFNFSKPQAEAPTAPAVNKDEDWDSIFGTASTEPTQPVTTNTEATSDGFDDAFSSFGDDFGKQAIQVPKATTTTTTTPAKQSSIGIVGDKIEEL
ncbi:hypothetical protein INT48_004729, partial [Thamnidium elegans]